MINVVFAAQSCSARNPADGTIVRLVANEPWHADDPFVVARPELFTDTPPHLKGTVPVRRRPVEQATAAPGERRVSRGR